MSNKNSLKDKIKKPTATQAFFKQYEDENDDSAKKDKDNGINKNIDMGKDIDENIDIDKDIDEDVDKDIDKDVDNNIDKNINENEDNDMNNGVEPKDQDGNNGEDFLGVLDNILSDEKVKKKKTKVSLGVYVDSEVAKVLDTLAKKNGYGTKSNVVNDILKAAFKQKGLIK